MELFNTYEKHIIELLMQHDKTLSELSTVLGISKPATSKHLKKLEKQHLIKGTYERTSVGRTRTYRLQPFQLVFSVDPSNKVIISFKADEPIDTKYLSLGYIRQKEFRDEVKTYVDEMSKSSLDGYMVVLYGSVAQGSAHRKSDIDLLVLKDVWLKQEKDEILNLLAIASNVCNHQVKPLFKGGDEFATMDEALQKQIKEHGIILFEKGKQWGRIVRQLKRYKSIMI